MKIALIKSTFYFNEPVNLTPLVKEIEVDLKDLSDTVLRKLNLGVVTGVIAVVTGKEEFDTRIAELLASDKKTKEVVKEVEQVVETIEQVVETTVEAKVEQEESKEVAVTEEPKKRPTTTKRTTATKKA